MSSSSEITLKQLFDKAVDLYTFLLKRWKVIVIFGLLGGVLGFVIAINSKKIYFGELTFALEEKSSSMGAYAAIASQFGVDIGSGGGGGAFGGDNLVELLKTRLMIEKTLINPVVINGDTELLVNRYINFKEYRKKWENKPALADLKYEIGVPRSSYSLTQDSVLNRIFMAIKKDMLTVKRVDKKLNMVKVVCSSEDELFSKYFAQELLDNASSYYVETKTKKIKYNISILEFKIDSVKQALEEKLYGAANAQDQNLNIVKARQKVPLVKQQIDIQLLTTVYAELSKNIELSRFALMRDEPIVNVIDFPILPLKTERASKSMYILGFGFLAGLLTIITILVKAKIDEIKKND